MNTCKSKIYLGFLILLAAACIPSSMLAANTTNYFDNPTTYTNGFESYTNMQWLAAGGGTDGWYAAEEDAIIVVTNNPHDFYGANDSLYNDYVLTNSPHYKILEIADTATNLITSTNSVSDVGIYVDMLLQPRRWEEEEHPEIEPDNRMGLYFNTNGKAVAYGDYYNVANGTNGTNWLELSGFTVASGQWVRVTIELQMNEAGADDYFKVRLDGIELQHPYGVKGTTAPNSTNNPGAWFKCPINTANTIQSVVFKGTGYLDDLQVSTNQPWQGTLYTVDAIVTPYNTAQVTESSKAPIDTEATWSFTEMANLFIACLPADGYNLTNVLVDGVSRPPNDGGGPGSDLEMIFGLDSNRTYQVQTTPETRELLVASYPGGLAYTADPANGSHDYDYNEEIALSSSLADALNTVTSRHFCTHITLSPANNIFGGVSTNMYMDDGTNFSFTIQAGADSNNVTTNMWFWRLQHKLETVCQSDDPYFVTNYSATVDGTDWHDDGSNVVITVTTNGNWSNVEWTGDTNGCTGDSKQLTVPMTNHARTIYANFLYQTNGGQHAIVITNYDRGFPDPVAGDFDDGDDMVLSISGSPTNVNSSNRFECLGWEGHGSVPASGSGTSTPTFKLIEDSGITWLWKEQNKLNITTSGTPGSVAVSPDTEWHATDSSVTLTAEPYLGSAFGSWDGSTNGMSDAAATYQTLSMAVSRTLDALFVDDPQTGVKGTPSGWFVSRNIHTYYDASELDLAEDDDLDGDNMENWKEYWTGTDPDDSNSLFQVTSQLYGPGSNCVVWYGSTNYGVTNYFSMYRSTNLLSAWDMVESNTIQRAADGTNKWWDTDVSTNPCIYRPTLLITY